MEGNNIRIVIIGLLVTMQLLFGCPVLLHQDHGCISLIHHFFHANIFHLAVNCMSIWALFRRGQTYGLSPFLWAYLIASISWFASSADPVGFSNIIFALVGLRTPSIKDRWWVSSSVITFLAITILMAFIPQVSAITHIVSFALGCLVAGASRIINNINRDIRRASYCQ
jgi:membrane associated rhomboid family serine protease